MDYTGQVVDGKYTLTRLLAEGGMGTVYLGKHNIINRKVAVKVLHGKYQGNENMVRRFYREAQAASAIEHKNIIEIIDVGVTADDAPCLVMEYLEGESLADLLQRTGPIDLAAACGILEPVLNALGAAHEKGVFHRDLKPENVFIVHVPKEPPVVKLIDFGISKIAGDSTLPKLTQTGAIMGTPLYMAPEQLQATDTVDGRTDLYAAGVIFFEMLTGALPFGGDNYNQMLASMLTQPPTPPQELYDKFPEEAEPVIMKALAKNQDERYQNVEEFLVALKDLTDFKERGARLTMYASGIKNRRIASGDLGESYDQDDSMGASELLSEMATNPTPGAWYKSTTASSKKKKGWGMWAGLGIGVALGLVLIAVLIGGGEKEEMVQKNVLVPGAAGVQPQPVARSPHVPVDTGVQIEVVGMPANGTITYDGMAIDLNPFPVEKALTMKKLKVEAAGYKPFVKGIIPAKSQKIEVTLTPLVPSPADLPAPAKNMEPVAKKNAAAEKTEKKAEPVAKKVEKKVEKKDAPAKKDSSKPKKNDKGGKSPKGKKKSGSGDFINDF